MCNACVCCLLSNNFVLIETEETEDLEHMWENISLLRLFTCLLMTSLMLRCCPLLFAFCAPSSWSMPFVCLYSYTVWSLPFVFLYKGKAKISAGQSVHQCAGLCCNNLTPPQQTPNPHSTHFLPCAYLPFYLQLPSAGWTLYMRSIAAVACFIFVRTPIGAMCYLL